MRVAGNTIFPPNFFGRFSILFAIIRQLHLTLVLLLTGEVFKYDYIFIDQLSACIPVLRFMAPKVGILFYCHFPDYLLTARDSFFKALYRVPFDWFEGITTGCAHAIVVNSRFTKSKFASAFPQISLVPNVVYPCVDTEPPAISSNVLPDQGHKNIVSINRFERKKNIELAIHAFKRFAGVESFRSRLIIAGGYDSRVQENVSYHLELAALCDELGLQHATAKDFATPLPVREEINVLFLLSIPASVKAHLLNTASLVVYTPRNEHFGIVPLEAMRAGVPVLAHNSGGPLETIQDGSTGWLREDDPGAWALVMSRALFELTDDAVKEMGRLAKENVERVFSRPKMAESLENEFDKIPERRGSPSGGLVLAILAGFGLVIGMTLYAMI